MAIINGTPGNDPFGTLNGTVDDDTINGFAGNDLLYGREGKDILNGGIGDDIFFYNFSGEISDALGNHDEIYGGTGLDTLQVLDSVDFKGGTISSIERILFTDTFAGNFRFVSINANQIGAAFASNLNVVGDTDEDVLQFDLGTNTTINLSNFTFSNWVGGATTFGGDRIQINGNAASETLIGSIINDYIDGAEGNDSLYGKAGKDFLDGGDGIDYLYGGLGADDHYGAAGLDYARYDDANYGNLVIRLDLPSLNTGAAAGDTYTEVEGLFGGAGNDTIVGNSLGNYLFGSGGGDFIRGGAGTDLLNGGADGDSLYGGVGADNHIGGDDAGLDFARYDDANHGNLTINLLAPNTNTGAALGDTYTGIEGIVGGLGIDNIVGNNLGNYLYGGGGNDYIQGLGGNDTLNGGAGADKFRFTTALNATTNVETIADFAHGTDDLWLTKSIFASIGTTLDATELRLGTAATDANDFIIYNSATGQLFYDANANALGGITQFASVTAGTMLDVSDFLMV